MNPIRLPELIFRLPTRVLILLVITLVSANRAEAADEITHRFLACGNQTYIVDAHGKKTWSYPHATRDGYVLANGDIVLVLNKGQRFKGGAVIQVTREGEESVIWQGTQSELNSAQPTGNTTFVITEAGDKPRLLEVDIAGKVWFEFPLQCQSGNHHMQTRMARKLADGNYIAPHLLDFAVKTYSPTGELLSTINTTAEDDPEHKIHTWPFTAIRHGDGQTLVCCTNGNCVLDFDKDGKVVWRLTNEDLPGPWLQDPCGAQVLPNGNVVIASYAAGQKNVAAPKLIEVNRDKEVVWTFTDNQKEGIHHFQILDTNGVEFAGDPMK